jgi:hypothetical protein
VEELEEIEEISNELNQKEGRYKKNGLFIREIVRV